MSRNMEVSVKRSRPSTDERRRAAELTRLADEAFATPDPDLVVVVGAANQCGCCEAYSEDGKPMKLVQAKRADGTRFGYACHKRYCIREVASELYAGDPFEEGA